MRHHNSIGFLLGFDRPTSESPKIIAATSASQLWCSLQFTEVWTCYKRSESGSGRCTAIEWFDPIWSLWLLPKFQPFSILAFSLHPPLTALRANSVANVEHFPLVALGPRSSISPSLANPPADCCSSHSGHLIPSNSVTTPPALLVRAHILLFFSQPSWHSSHNRFNHNRKRSKIGRVAPLPDCFSGTTERVRGERSSFETPLWFP